MFCGSGNRLYWFDILVDKEVNANGVCNFINPIKLMFNEQEKEIMVGT